LINQKLSIGRIGWLRGSCVRMHKGAIWRVLQDVGLANLIRQIRPGSVWRQAGKHRD
jgi:hypothetical protein